MNIGMLQYNFSEIVILADRENKKEAKKKISEIKIMLDNNASFESIAAKFSDAIVILTEWEEFKNINWSQVYKYMRKPAWIFDSRSFLDNKNLRSLGFNLWTLGSL